MRSEDPDQQGHADEFADLHGGAPADVSMLESEPFQQPNASGCESIVLFVRRETSSRTQPVCIDVNARPEDLIAVVRRTHRFDPSKDVLMAAGRPILADAPLALQGIRARSVLVIEAQTPS